MEECSINIDSWKVASLMCIANTNCRCENELSSEVLLLRTVIDRFPTRFATSLPFADIS